MRRPSCHLTVITATALFLLVGCEPETQPESVTEDSAAIRKSIERLTDAYATRDWEAFAGFFADDGVWMPPDVAPLRGKEAWWSFVQPWWDSSTVLEIGSTTEKLVVIDDWAIEFHSEYQVITFGDSTEAVSLYFKGIWIFRRQGDDSWRITQYIWDEDAPPN